MDFSCSRSLFLFYVLFMSVLMSRMLEAGQIFFRELLVFEGSSLIPECYHPSLLCLPDGTLACVWASGSGSLALDTSIQLSFKRVNDIHWTPPVILADDEGYPDNYPVLMSFTESKIRLIYATLYREKRKAPPGENLAAWHLKYLDSSDGGHSWGNDFFLVPESGLVPCSPVIKLENGNLILPASDIRNFSAVFLISQDSGGYWDELSRITTPAGLIDPVVVELNPDHLIALLRPYESGQQKHVIWWVESNNYGQTWSETQPTEIRNPAGPIALLKLANSHLVLAYNDHESWLTPLTLAVSLDGGLTWPYKRNIETGQWDIRDPYLIQTKDGRIHLAYISRNIYLKHIEFSESWILEEPLREKSE
jgi:predicted neuraminidase